MRKIHNILNITAIDTKEPMFKDFLSNMEQDINILPIDEKDFWKINKEKP